MEMNLQKEKKNAKLEKATQQLSALAAPPEDLGSIPSTHLRWLTVPGDLTVSLGTDMHAGKT